MNKIQKTAIGVICGIASITAISIPVVLSMSSCSKDSTPKASPTNWFEFDKDNPSKIIGINEDLVKDASELVIPAFVTDIAENAFGSFDMSQPGGDEVPSILPNIKKVDLSLTKLEILRGTYRDETQGGWTGVFNYFFNLEEVVLPNTLTEIQEFVFVYCGNLTKINVPNSLTTIGRNAFWGCVKLSNFDFTNLQKIGEESFAYTGITEFVMRNIEYYTPNENTPNNIYTSTFAGSQLSKLTINPDVEIIYGGMFRECKLEKVIIPASVTTIGEEAFADNKLLNEIVISSDSKLTNISSDSFTINENTKIYVPNNDIKKIFTDANYPENNIIVQNN